MMAWSYRGTCRRRRGRQFFAVIVDQFLSLSLASNGPIAATGGWDRTARLWNWQTGQAIAILPTHANAVESVAFSPDDRVLATSANGVIKLWNVSAEIGDDSTLQAHMGGLNTLAFSTDGRFFSTAGADGRVTVWDAASRRVTMTFEFVRGSTTPADAQTTATAIVDAIDRRTPVRPSHFHRRARNSPQPAARGP